METADDGQGLGPPESISAINSESRERGDEPMDVDTWPGHVDNGAPQDVESGVHPADESQVVESAPVDNVPVDNASVDNAPVDNVPVDNMPVESAPIA